MAREHWNHEGAGDEGSAGDVRAGLGRSAPSPGVQGPPAGIPSGPLTSHQFAEQFQASYRLLWLIAAGIVGERAGAEDVVQEAAVLALEKLDQFQPGTNFRAWMAQMVRFVALNHARRQQKHRSVGEAVAQSGPHSLGMVAPQPADLRLGKRGELPSDQAHFDDRLVLALNSVNDIARACLLLRTVEQLEYSEISRVLGIPEGTAMSHVHRTRQYLRERLADLAPPGTSADDRTGRGGIR